MSCDLRLEVPLIGYSTFQIVAHSNLLTIQQVLSVLFYNMRRLSNSLDNSAKLVIEECVIFYINARIPTQDFHKCVEKFKSEYNRWRKITKNSSRKSETQKNNKAIYKQSLNKLFDIAKANACDLMIDEDDIKFLQNQRDLLQNVSLAVLTCTSDPVSEKLDFMEEDDENFEKIEPSIPNTDKKFVNVQNPSKSSITETATKEELNESSVQNLNLNLLSIRLLKKEELMK